MKMLALLMLHFLMGMALVSCTMMDEKRVVALGGAGAYNGRNFSGTWDNRESFRDAAVLATAAVGAWASVASDKAAEATARTVNTNATKQAIHAKTVDGAVQQSTIKAGVQQTEILAR